MSRIRKAHSVEIIDRRLATYEVEGVADAMELVGLHDELARVDRKWREKAAGAMPAQPGRGARPPANAAPIDGRFARLLNLLDATLRRGVGTDAERDLLRRAAESVRARAPLAEAS
jgi:hypothetical protein